MTEEYRQLLEDGLANWQKIADHWHQLTPELKEQSLNVLETGIQNLLDDPTTPREAIERYAIMYADIMVLYETD